MFRFDYMPSDFYPIFLFLGEADDLSEFANLMLDFQHNPRTIVLREFFPEAEGKTALTLAHAEGEGHPYGIHERTTDGSFVWTLNIWQAGQVAQRIQALTPRELKSGNDILEFGLDREIPIKISRGEFTDNFLTPLHHLHPDYVPPSEKSTS